MVTKFKQSQSNQSHMILLYKSNVTKLNVFNPENKKNKKKKKKKGRIIL